jgi:hypothetical protein
MQYEKRSPVTQRQVRRIEIATASIAVVIMILVTLMIFFYRV